MLAAHLFNGLVASHGADSQQLQPRVVGGLVKVAAQGKGARSMAGRKARAASRKVAVGARRLLEATCAMKMQWC